MASFFKGRGEGSTPAANDSASPSGNNKKWISRLVSGAGKMISSVFGSSDDSDSEFEEYDAEMLSSDSYFGSHSEDKDEEQEQVEKSPQSTLPETAEKEKKKNPVQRIWTLEDEMTLLLALSDYHIKNGKLPPSKDHASFLSTISASISFSVTLNQLRNKIRTMRFNYYQNKKKGSNLKFSTPHDKVVFYFCTKLFENGNNASKEGEKGRSYFYLEGLIKDMISTYKCLRWFSTVEEVVEEIGESMALDLEARTKMLRMDAIKLRAREENLINELFEILADKMVDV